MLERTMTEGIHLQSNPPHPSISSVWEQQPATVGYFRRWSFVSSQSRGSGPHWEVRRHDLRQIWHIPTVREIRCDMWSITCTRLNCPRAPHHTEIMNLSRLCIFNPAKRDHAICCSHMLSPNLLSIYFLLFFAPSLCWHGVIISSWGNAN